MYYIKNKLQIDVSNTFSCFLVFIFVLFLRVIEFQNSLDSLVICLRDNIPETHWLEEAFGIELCSENRNKIQNCFGDLANSLQKCATPEETYFPQFLTDGIGALLEYLCRNNRAILKSK